ncbi:hypothetical protein [Mycobacterium sp. IS-1742]|uniref:hypothetical protein n=1 Tax=Mycobacterium sp. IS-1742 TaxID=1772285 RepID=UPI000AAA8DEA|nr:hypothetical protein [Mycobacterium sp. IS-1742]
MNGHSVGVDSAQLNTASPTASPIAVVAICFACGYPTMHPGLCAYCRPVPML